MDRRKALFLVLRIVAFAAVVAFLATQLSWYDRLYLVGDDEPLVGRAERLANGDWRVEKEDAGQVVTVEVPAAAVATRGTGERQVPSISWGLRTLGRRLGDDPGTLALVLAFFAFLLCMTAWRWRLLLRAVDLVLRLARAVRLTWIGAFFNMAIPGSTGGDIVKAYYAARSTGRATRSVISVFVDRALGLLGLAVMAAIALLAAPAHTGYGPAKVVVLCVLGGAVVFLLVIATPLLRRGLGLGKVVRKLPFQPLLAEARTALRLYKGRPLSLGIALAVSLVNHGSVALCVWLLARALRIEGLELGMALVLVPVANLFTAVPLVPGGWGIGELAFAWLFGQVGIAPTEAVGLSVVYRLSALVVSLPGGLLWLFWPGRPSKETILHEVEEATQQVQEAGAA